MSAEVTLRCDAYVGGLCTARTQWPVTDAAAARKAAEHYGWTSDGVADRCPSHPINP